MTTTDTGPQTARERMRRNIERLNSDGAVAEYLRFRFREDVRAIEREAATPPLDPTCQHDDAGQPCGRHLERGECSVHGRAAWPNPDACCSRNAFEDDAHSPTCPNASDYTRAFHERAATSPLDVLRDLVTAWDAMHGKVRFQGTAPDSVDRGLAFDAAMDRARARLAQQDGTGE